jgi:RNA polymerase sigma-70 factor (ECF subfamily)
MHRRILPPEIHDWLELVIQDNADDLLRYLTRRVNQREDAADLLGSVFLILWEKGARVPTTDEDARMWCFGIARNVLREHRRRAMKSIGLANALRTHLRDIPQPDNSADAIAESTLRASDVRNALITDPSRDAEGVDGVTIRALSTVSRHNRTMVNLRAGHIGVGLAVIAVCALAGCTAPGAGVAQKVRPGAPDGLVVEPLSDGPTATWIEPAETFAIVTFGSGSCPSVATALAATGSDRIAVTFGPSPNDPCTADIAPTTHEFDLPDEITNRPVILEINYEEWPEAYTLTLE